MSRSIIGMVAFFLICPLSASHADNYYLSPSGNDGNSGVSTDQAWASLGFASDRLSAGDTLFIMGGEYNSNQTCRYPTSGTRDNPIVYKAYGDSRAVFKRTGGSGENIAYFFSPNQGADYITIDGTGHLDPSSSYWEMRCEEAGVWSLISFSGNYSNYCEHIDIKGLLLNGLDADTLDSVYGGGIRFEFCRYSSIENCTIQYVRVPTGDSQGTGDGIGVYACEFLKIHDNTINRCNHSSMNISTRNPSYPSRYIWIKGNKIDGHWGDGFHIQGNSEYCLIEHNVITHTGGTTTYTKPGIMLGGSSMTVRYNVIYNPSGGSIDMEAQTVVGHHNVVENCHIYNNTIFGCEGYSLRMLTSNRSSTICRVENNHVYNNILCYSTGVTYGHSKEIDIVTYHADADNNWVVPETSDSEPLTTNWNGNKFYNNCIRRNDDGAGFATLIVFGKDSDIAGDWFFYSLDACQSQDPVAWHDNIGADPLLRSERPDSHGLFNYWWRIQEGSPCIDAGIFPAGGDPIVNHVNSLNTDPEYVWPELRYGGSAPDIGAYEYNSEDPTPMSAPSISISPGE
jgi:hypothetical protein